MITWSPLYRISQRFFPQNLGPKRFTSSMECGAVHLIPILGIIIMIFLILSFLNSFDRVATLEQKLQATQQELIKLDERVQVLELK